MYFTAYHVFSIFASIVIYAFMQFLIYHFVKDRKKLYVFSLTLFIITSIVSYSLLLTLNDILKDAELKNVESYKAGNNVVVRGTIYNTGKAPVKTCKISIRISNTAPKKVDGTIFDTSKSFDPFSLQRPRNSYLHDYIIKGVINEKTTKSVTMHVPYPPHFQGYKISYIISCK